MSWDITKAAFKDELKKIAEVNLSAVSPERLQTMFEGPAPLETDGYSKAKQVLQRASGMNPEKTAAISPNRLPQLNRLTNSGFKKEDGPPPDAVDKAKRFGGHILAGGGAGRFISEFTPKHIEGAASTKRKFIGTAVGAGLGAAEFARKTYRQSKWEKQKTSAISPSMSLKADRQVGTKVGTRPTGVTSIKSIVPKIGKVGVPNLV